MKRNLFLTTALVATTFVAGNAMAMTISEFLSGESEKSGTFYLEGSSGTMENDMTVTGQVTLHDPMTIDGGKNLTVNGFLTETNSGTDISGINANVNKNGTSGGLIIGNDLTVGNLTMGDGTFIGLYTHEGEAYSENPDKTLNIVDGKTLTFAGSGVIGSTNIDPEDPTFKRGNLTINGNVENQGTLKLGNAVKIVNGNIINKGTLTANADKVNGEVTLDDSESLYKVTGGTISKDVSGAGALNITGNVISDAVLSAGAISVANSGDAENPYSLTTDAGNLASDVTNGGSVALTGGTLSKNIAGGTTNITGNVVLGKSIDFDDGAVNVAEGATLDAGSNQVKTAGDVKFNNGSTLAFDSNSSQEKVIDANSVVLSGDVNVNTKFAAGVSSSSVKIADSINTNDGSFKVASNNLYNVSIDDEGKLVAEKKSGSEIAASTGATQNQAGTVSALTSATSSNPILNNIIENVNSMLQSGDAAATRAALDAVTALAPEVTPVVQQTQLENANQVFNAVSTRLSGGALASAIQGQSSGDEMFENGAMWVQMLYNHADKNDTRKAKGYEADSTGVAFGFEKQVNDAVKAGVGYAYTQTDVDGFKRDTDIDTHTAFVYGEYKPSAWFVNAIASYNWSDYDETKFVLNNRVKASYDVESLGLQAMTGYDIDFCNNTVLTPEAGLRFVHVMQDGYKDKAGQYIYGDDADLLTGVVGAKISHNFELENGWNLRPEMRLAATYDLMTDDGNSLVSLANGAAYRVKGEKLDRFGMETEFGLTADVTDNVSVSMGYQGRFRDHYEDHTGLISAKYKF